jgi:hypothetical protein
MTGQSYLAFGSILLKVVGRLETTINMRINRRC